MYKTKDGTPIPITVAASFAGDPAVAQTYADFLGTLPHGSELADLKVTIVPSAKVNADCGGQQGDSSARLLLDAQQRHDVPGDLQAAAAGVTASYVITHEYGHHVAAHRSDAPLSAPDYGPKRWSSYELVCRDRPAAAVPRERGGVLPPEPGRELGGDVRAARLPEAAMDVLRPAEAGRGCPRRRAGGRLEPWTGPMTKRLRGTFAAGGPATQSFKLPLTLDGAMKLSLAGPKGTNLDLRVTSLGKVQAQTDAAGSSDHVSYGIACRECWTEVLTLTVQRRSGVGAPTPSPRATRAERNRRVPVLRRRERRGRRAGHGTVVNTHGMLDWGVGDYEVTAAELEPAADVAVQRVGIAQGERVLDIGCGTGNAALAAARAGAVVTGIDPADRLVGVAAARAAGAGHDARFVVGDAQDLPFPDGAFDAAVSVFALIFVSEPGRAATSCSASCAGRRAVFTTWVPVGGIPDAVGIMAAAGSTAAGLTPRPPFPWGEETALRELFEARGAQLSVAEHELAFTAASVDSYLTEMEEHHPLAIPARAAPQRAGSYDAVRRQAHEILTAANEDPPAFRVTSRYLVAAVSRPAA